MDYNTEDSTLHPVVGDIVEKIKADGIFDVLRKECLADVDSKPAYQNLKQKVENACSRFLSQIIWTPTLNKNQIREQLRNEINSMGFINSSVGRIVNQVVTPKIDEEIRPKVENVVKEYYGYDERQENEELNTSYNSLPVDTSQPPPSISLYPFNPYEPPPLYAGQPPLPGFESQQTAGNELLDNQTDDQLPEAGVENRAEEPMEMSDDEKSEDKPENNEDTGTAENTEIEDKGGDLAQGLADYMKEEVSATPPEPQDDDMSISTPSNEGDSRPSSQATSIHEEGETSQPKELKIVARRSTSRTEVAVAVPARRESRRQRTRNRKYFDDDFTSIFTERKDLLSESYTNQVVTEEVVTMDTETTIQLEEETVLDVAQIIEPTIKLSDIKSQTIATDESGAEAKILDTEASSVDADSAGKDNEISKSNTDGVLGRKPVKFTINTRRSLMASKSEDQIDSAKPSSLASRSATSRELLVNLAENLSDSKISEHNSNGDTGKQKSQQENSHIQPTQTSQPRRSTRIRTRNDNTQSDQHPETNKQTAQSDSLIDSVNNQSEITAQSPTIADQTNPSTSQTEPLPQQHTENSTVLLSTTPAGVQETSVQVEIIELTSVTSATRNELDPPAEGTERANSVDMDISDEDESFDNKVIETPSIEQITETLHQTVEDIPTENASESELRIQTIDQPSDTGIPPPVLESDIQLQENSSEAQQEQPITDQEESAETKHQEPAESGELTSAVPVELEVRHEESTNKAEITEQLHIQTSDEITSHLIQEAECPASPTPSDQRGELDDSGAEDGAEDDLELKEIEELERLAKKKMAILKSIEIPDTVDISLRHSTADNYSSEEEEGEITDSSDDSRGTKKKKSKKKSSKKKKKKESKKRKRHLDEFEGREAKRTKHRPNY